MIIEIHHRPHGTMQDTTYHYLRSEQILGVRMRRRPKPNAREWELGIYLPGQVLTFNLYKKQMAEDARDWVLQAMSANVIDMPVIDLVEKRTEEERKGKKRGESA